MLDVPRRQRFRRTIGGAHLIKIWETCRLASSRVAERLRVTRFLAGGVVRKLRNATASPVGYLSRWRFPTPERLLIAPQDIRTTDPTIADDIYSGYFNFGSRIVNTHGRSPFELASPSAEWEAALNGFGWLRHLRAADTPLAKANARALVAEWIASRGRAQTGPAWSPAVAARRLLSWLSQSPLILEGADRAFYRRFMKSLGWHARVLQRVMPRISDTQDRLIVAMALTQLGLCAQGFDKVQRRASRWLTEEISRQILPDGGHVGRCPQTLVDLLLDILPLRQAFVARSVPVPPPLLHAVDRMMPMLRLFRHQDGALALFNGMGVTAPDRVATALAYDDARARPLTNAPQSGYQRMEADDAVVIVDSGKPPPLPYSGEAHAGCLSFEFSAGGYRLLVNCGAPVPGRAAFRLASRASAAHNALVVADTNSSRIAASRAGARTLEGLIVSGPSDVRVQRADDADSSILQMSHDGYEQRFGLIHHRCLTLAHDGRCLSGEETLATSGRRGAGATAEFAVRFHVHPQVRLARLENGSLLLEPPSGDVWVFAADDLAPEVEESIFFAAPDGARAAQQIVLHGRASQNSSVRWSLTRHQTETS